MSREQFRVPVAVLIVLLAAGAGCSAQPRATGVYTPDTRVLTRLDYDYNGDGRIDVRTYMRDGKPLRLEGDTDADGIVDRWEYYGADGQLLRIGGSTEDDGREDTWVRTAGDERIVEFSTRRDGVADRREVYRGERLMRTESDTNHDGLPDVWETFEDGAVTELLLDDDKRSGRPTRRIVYGAGNARVETIDQGGRNASR